MRDVNEGGTHTHTHVEREIDCVGERGGGGMINNKRGGRGE